MVWTLFGDPSRSPLVQHKPMFQPTHMTLTFSLLYTDATISPSSLHHWLSIFRSFTHSRSARKRWRLLLGSGSQRQRGSPRLRGGVSGSPSRLSPVASRPCLWSSAHRPATLHACLPPSEDRRRPSAPACSGNQQPLLHQGGHTALLLLMSQSEMLPVRLVPLFGTLIFCLLCFRKYNLKKH